MGPEPLAGPSAALEIFSVDGQWVTGKITGLKDPTFSEAPDYDGALFAVRCPQ